FGVARALADVFTAALCAVALTAWGVACFGGWGLTEALAGGLAAVVLAPAALSAAGFVARLACAWAAAAAVLDLETFVALAPDAECVSFRFEGFVAAFLLATLAWAIFCAISFSLYIRTRISCPSHHRLGAKRAPRRTRG